MGTPKSKKKKYTPEPEAPSLAEKMRLLELGEHLPWESPQFVLGDALLSMKEYLEPMVPWLDADLMKSYPFQNQTNPATRKPIRGMIIFEGYGIGLPSFALGRSGDWIVKEKNEPTIMSTGALAKLLVNKIEKFTEASHPMTRMGHDNLKKIFQMFPSTFSKLTLQHTMMWLIRKCWETIDKGLKQREERIRILRERLDFLKEFSGSMDPLLRSGEHVPYARFSIWRENEGGGERNCAWSYLHEDTLKPFWEHINKTQEPEKKRYKTKRWDLAIDSIERFFGVLSDMCSDITSTQRSNRTDAKDLLGYSDGRLDFSEAELAEIQRIAKAISEA